MPDHVPRTEQLELLRSLRSISPQGARGLAMLAKGVALADENSDGGNAELDLTGSLICYCIREAIDSIFPKLGDPRIKEVAQRLVKNWRRQSARPDTDLGTGLHDDLTNLERAVEASTAGFMPRVSGLLGVLHPGLPAGLSIPAMTALRDLNRAANDGVHGHKTREEAVELLDLVLVRLVELVAPLAVTAQQYQALVDEGDFQGLATLLAANSDPRIRVYLFDRVRDPRLAQALDVVELLPGSELWLAYGYVRHLAEDDPEAFTALVDRVIAANRLSTEVATQLLICATFAGAVSATEVERLSASAGGQMRTELMARWLRGQVDAVSETAWWKILTRVIEHFDPSARHSQSLYEMDELLDLAASRLRNAPRHARSRYNLVVIKALGRLDAHSPYAVQFHFDNGHLRARSTTNLLIDAAVGVLALAQSEGQPVDLTALSVRSRETLSRASIAPAIELASPDRAFEIAAGAFDLAIARMSGDDWPDASDLDTLRAVIPVVGANAVERIAAALGEPPAVDVLGTDLGRASEVRADWFRTAQWAAHLPEGAQPSAWVETLRQSADRGIEFGPPPTVDRFSWPSAHPSPLGDLDIPSTTVPELVSLLNGAVGVSEPEDPRFAMNLQETITSHTGTHREAWVSDHASILQIHDLWTRLAILRSLKSQSNDAARLRWEQLQSLWTGLVAEAAVHEADGIQAARPAVTQLAEEILEHLRHRVDERPRQANDIDWWAQEVLPAAMRIVSWVGSDEQDFGMPALFSLRGQTVRLLIALSSPIDDDATRDASLSRALDLLADAASVDPGFARSLGHWARWLIRRDPEWWSRHANHLIGSDSSPAIHDSLLTANWESNDFAPTLLGSDVALLNSFASQSTDDAGSAVMSAVLFEALPITSIEESTWSAIFRDGSSTEGALRYLFPEHSIEEDLDATRRLDMLLSVATDAARANRIWRSVDVLAGSPDVSDDDLFSFTAELAESNRGAPLSTHRLSERFVRRLDHPDAVLTLESMCSGNLGADRAMAQYDMEPVNVWFQGEGQQLPSDLRTRVQRALFEIGFDDEHGGVR